MRDTASSDTIGMERVGKRKHIALFTPDRPEKGCQLQRVVKGGCRKVLFR
uniref:Uncharacterized protein n=1 Tax=Candidatus Kentrum sp. FW TaxID=2126338 RepID=A0A450RYN1_9GAMM|nr:MAG: hypothetical protein BECKFW1821A_GA0114235_100640 [Candidatus Kentron sp. FW]